MKSFRGSNTVSYNPFVSRNYREGRECELDYLDTSGITKPFSRSLCFSFAHNLPKLIFPRHLQEFFASYRIVEEALEDECWTMAMHHELNQLTQNSVWKLVPPPRDHTILESEWSFENTMDENGIVSLDHASCLKRFDLENAKSIKTPMSTDLKLTLDEDGVSVDSSKYRCMIGNLLYLTDYRPDIMVSVSLCARFQDNPKESHMDAVLRIFRYIKSTQYLGL
ncbi:hypothetical protein Tco_0299365 [Tanacetum coccineum]